MEKKIGVFYGSSLGTTEALAKMIAKEMDVPATDVYDVAGAEASRVGGFDVLLLGSSTWGSGELQDDWYDFLKDLKKQDLTGKYIALFGCGDAESYPDTFCEALAVIHDDLVNTGGEFIGAFVPEGFPDTDSRLLEDGKYLGLAIDDTNEGEKTESRVKAWVSLLKKEIV